MTHELIFSVVGARPHFIKAAPFMKAMQSSANTVFTIHTGQHYDTNMSDIFFTELELPKPDINLGIGSGSHAVQTSAVLIGIEELLFQHKPTAIVVYGDTNTTLGAALAAAKHYIPIVHVEAGVRCGNRRMPEEINRGIIDNISDFLCCPSELAVQNLKLEGLTDGVHNIGDFMYDTFLKAKADSQKIEFDTSRFGFKTGDFILATLHREETTKSAEKLSELLDTLGNLGVPVILPMHPRTRACLLNSGISLKRKDGLKIIEPLSYLEMVSLLCQCVLVITDSGGVQKEAYWAKVRCLTLMDETTWPETIEAGCNKLVGLTPSNIKTAALHYLHNTSDQSDQGTEIYGTPGAAVRMVKELGWV